MSGYHGAFEHDILNKALQLLQESIISKRPIDANGFSDLFPKAAWLATFLSNSKYHKHRQKALLFAALAKLVLKNNHSLEIFCYTIFARAGALPAAMHLEKIVGAKQEYIGPDLGPLSNEFLTSYMDSYSELNGGTLLTEFQNETFDSLTNQPHAVISAPTSAGKSFIVHEYVKNRLLTGEKFISLFIVPTKALISQTCAIYRRFKTKKKLDIAIHSSVSEEMDSPPGSAILALTQERCIRLLSTPIAKQISFVFVDEIQSLEKDDRGALLEYVLHEIRLVAPKARLFAAGPFISNGRELGRCLFAENCPSIDTEDSPVSQMVLQVTPVKGSKVLQTTIVDSLAAENDFTFEIDVDRAMHSRWQGSQTKAVNDAVRIFATDSPSLVYAKGQGTAQNWARAYIEEIETPSILSEEAKDLILYLRDSIHPQCSLIDSLKKRVAYHHGGLPDFVREEIEALFSQKEIDVLFCTSTLLEGVNLPADKIFVVSPAKAREALTPFEFKNLTGRAGRLDEHLCGMVYCVHVPNDDNCNPFDAFRGDTQKEVKPTIDERLASSFEQIHDLLLEGKPLLPEQHSTLRSTATILRSRFLRSRQHAAEYLSKKRLSQDQQNRLMDALTVSSCSLSIPHDLALKNPYIDPFLQDVLYQRVVEDPQQWAIRSERGLAVNGAGKM
jgi:hypothetical protein